MEHRLGFSSWHPSARAPFCSAQPDQLHPRALLQSLLLRSPTRNAENHQMLGLESLHLKPSNCFQDGGPTPHLAIKPWAPSPPATRGFFQSLHCTLSPTHSSGTLSPFTSLVPCRSPSLTCITRVFPVTRLPSPFLCLFLDSWTTQ